MKAVKWILAAILTMAAVAQAAPTWTDPQGGSNVLVAGDLITWGLPYGQPNQSGLEWLEASWTPSPTPFILGELFHDNFPQTLGTSPSGVDMTIFGVVTFTLSIDETPNTGGPVDDIIGFPSSMPTWGNIEIIGFGPSAGNILPFFTSPENGTNSTELWAKAPERIPAPGALLLAGIGYLGVRRRRL